MNARLSIDWPLLRPKNGDLDAGFEELCRQLIAREPEAQGLSWIATGKVDGGVEYYGHFPSGSVWGIQAKWFLQSLDASEWTQVDKSVQTALSARPKLSRYTVCFPINLSDSPKKGRTTAREQWEARKLRYEGWAAAKSMAVDFVLWDDHALTTRLTDPDNRGIIAYWFGAPLFSEDWFRRRSEDAVERAGRRYTPEHNVNTPLGKLIDGLTINKNFLTDFESSIKSIRKNHRVLQDDDVSATDHAEVLKARDCVRRLLATNESLRANAFSSTNWKDLGETAAAASSAVYSISSALHEQRPTVPGQSGNDRLTYQKHQLRELAHGFYGASEFCTGKAAELATLPALLLVGTAGSGKTHFLCDVVSMSVKANMPAVLLFGDQFGLGNPWKSVGTELELPHSHEELLGALQSIAEMKHTRALLVVDALNEGVGAKLWRDALPQLVQQVSRFPNVALIVSVRDTFEPQVVRKDAANRFVRAVHHGFAYDPLEAQRIYFAGYGIVEPSTPLLLPEFENPLFLKLFCEGLDARGLHEIPRGIEGISAIFNFYLETLNERVSSAINCDPDENVVTRSLNDLVLAIADAPHRALTKAEAKAIVERTLPTTLGWDRSLFNQLLRDGALSEIALDSEIRIRFTYERLADHILARKMIDEMKASDDVLVAARKAVTNVVDDDLWINAGLYEALVVQTPELLGKEIIDLTADHNLLWQNRAFLKSLSWRLPTTISGRTIEIVLEMLAEPSVRPAAIEAVLRCALILNHPLGADWLSGWLKDFRLAERDEIWTITISEGFREGSSVERLIYWALNGAFGASGTSERSRVTRRLAITTLLWTCTSSSRVLRDRATKAIVALFDHGGEDASTILSTFWSCNDPYVVQRLLATTAAFAMRLNAPSEHLTRLADTVLQQIGTHGLPVDLLARDSARTIVLRAKELRALPPGCDLASVTPPYGTEAPKHLSTDLARFKRGDWQKITAADRQNGATGLLRVKSSLEIKFGDFFRYVIEPDVGNTWYALTRDEPVPKTRHVLERELKETLTEPQAEAWGAYELFSDRSFRTIKYVVVDGKPRIEKLDANNQDDREELSAYKRAVASSQARLNRMLKPEQKSLLERLRQAPSRLPKYDNELAATWIFRRVIEFGYTNEAFGRYDEDVSNSDWGREPKSVERIGKKYQWIAFFELQARLADNYKLANDSLSDVDATVEYVSPHQVVSRDIDATILLTGTHTSTFGAHEPNWWCAQKYSSWLANRRFDDWSRSKSDLPDIREAIAIKGPDSAEWIALSLHLDWLEEVELPADDDDDYPRRELWYSILGYLVPREKVDECLQRSARDYSGSRKSPRDEYRLLWGELFWSPAFDVDNYGMAVQRDANANPQSSIATAHYLRETGRDKSSENSYSISFPIREIVEGIGAVGSDPERGAWLDTDGTVLAFDPTVTEAGAGALLIRKDALETFLRSSPFALVWTVLGEKQSRGGWDSVKATGRFEMTGTFVWRESPAEMIIEGETTIEFIKWPKSGKRRRQVARKTA